MTELAYAVEATPAEITAVLHEHIARIDPDRAALVAAFEAIDGSTRPRVQAPRPPSGRMRRMRVYASLRLDGTGKKAAARRAGVSHRTADRYESDLIASLGGGS